MSDISKDILVNVIVLAKHACDGRGCRRFVFIKRKEGHLVQYAALRENQERDCRELQEAIEHMKEKQSRLLETMERKQKLMSGAQEEIWRRAQSWKTRFRR